MAEVILKDYRLLPIVFRFGLTLGFGNKTVEEICKEKDIDTDFFLEILNSHHNSVYFPNNHLSDFKADIIIKYLTNTHAYYLENKVPRIESYIAKLEKEVAADDIKNINLLRCFFYEYRSEIEVHFKVEEERVFPYILALEKALKTGNCSEELFTRIKEEPIEIYERNHDDLEVKLSDMKNLIIRFLPVEDCIGDYEYLLAELFQMEYDLEDHARIEEKVLVPKVKMLETKVLEYYGAC